MNRKSKSRPDLTKEGIGRFSKEDMKFLREVVKEDLKRQRDQRRKK